MEVRAIRLFNLLNSRHKAEIEYSEHIWAFTRLYVKSLSFKTRLNVFVQVLLSGEKLYRPGCWTGIAYPSKYDSAMDLLEHVLVGALLSELVRKGLFDQLLSPE